MNKAHTAKIEQLCPKTCHCQSRKAQIERSPLCMELFPDRSSQPGPTNRLSDLLNHFFQVNNLSHSYPRKNYSIPTPLLLF